MYCSECGESMQWRCTDNRTNIAKYKCPHCGNVQLGEDDYKEPVPTVHIPKYYYFKDGRYIVRKFVGREHRCIYIGSYADEDTANKVVEKMIEYDWDKNKVPLVHEELNIQRINRTWVCA
ncbi:MAG: hypothetical protein J6W71_00150 [Methanobrevibacter sp.]|nr:hypothetical protein [Methanobrevibacter sp.]